MRNRFLLCGLLAAALLSPRPAAADPLEITSGVFVIDLGVDIFTFAGDGFRLQTAVPDPLDLIQSIKLFERGPESERIGQFPGFAIETEGQVLDWGFETTGGEQLLGRGDVSLGGITASNVDFRGSVRFDAVPTPLISNGSLDFEYVAPFSFTAMIRGVQNGQELFAREFIGRGWVSVNYEGSPAPGAFGFADESIRYEFSAAEPVPEPATLLLIGSGLAAGVLRRRRRDA